MISKEYLNYLFEYKNGEIYWKITANPRAQKDSIAGLKNCRYSRVGINGQKYLKNRIIYMMHNGYCMDEIVFLDKNPLNCCIDNLKAATRSDVVCYSKRRKDNTSGYRGVSFDKRKGEWVGYIEKEKKKKWLGYFTTKEEAHVAYRKAALELHKEFVSIDF